MSVEPSAQKLVEKLTDPGSFTPLPGEAFVPDDASYAAELEHARQLTGLNEAVLAGSATIGGHRVVLVVSEFAFLGGSIGEATGRLILQAIDHASDHRLPLLLAPCSGGTRIQEGTPAFVGMIPIAQAVQAHGRAGLPCLVHLRHPATGGVLASWGSLGQLTSAAPGSLVGLLGPRVQEALVGSRIPDGVQRAENLHARGIVDALVPDDELREYWRRILDILTPADRKPNPQGRFPRTAPPPSNVWESVMRTRQPGRPSLDDILRTCASDAIALSGSGDGRREDSVTAQLVRILDRPLMLVGTREDRMIGPDSLRLARRAYRLAEELGLGVVSVIDTPGARLDAEAENGALSAEIARCLADLSRLRTPVVSVIKGQGSGGAALALLPADRTLCASSGWLAPLAPEGASAILHRTHERTDEIARHHRIGAIDLLRAGVVDLVLPEPERFDEPSTLAWCRQLADEIVRQLDEISAATVDSLPFSRRQRFRSFGRLGGAPDRG